jgi:hypothetical protein
MMYDPKTFVSHITSDLAGVFGQPSRMVSSYIREHSCRVRLRTKAKWCTKGRQSAANQRLGGFDTAGAPYLRPATPV